MLWIVRAGSSDEEEALSLARATPQDLADAAALGPERGAARLYRRRLLRAFAARTLAVHPDAVGIARNDSGGVAITGPTPLFASVSGRDGWTALALSEHPVGVDVESRPAETPLPLDLLHPRERDHLRGLEGAAANLAFLRFWTAREAYVKATGAGLPIELSRIEARDDGKGQEVLLREDGVVRARACPAVTDDYVAAVVQIGAPD